MKKILLGKVRPVYYIFGQNEVIGAIKSKPPRASWEVLALKGSDLAQMAKYILRGLGSQTRPHFHTVMVTEYGLNIKIPNIAFRRSFLAHFF